MITRCDATGSFADGSVFGTLNFDVTAGRIVTSSLITTDASTFTCVDIVNRNFTQVPADSNVR